MISERNQRRIVKSVVTALGRKVVVINVNYMGLGNRLKLLANFDTIWGLNNTTLLWNNQGWVNCRLQEIIDIEGVTGWKEIPIRVTRCLPPIICVPEHDCFWPRGYWRFHVEEDLGSEFLITRQGRTFPSIDSLYERTPQQFVSRYRPFFAKLRPSPAVAQRIAAIDVNPADVCVQVRNTLDPDDQAHTPHLESVIAQMERYPSHTNFFVSTLDASITSALKKAFGSRVRELPQKNYRSMIDATADMFLLARGHELIVAAGSTFGEVAWWLGDCRQSVIQLAAEN